MADKVAQNTFDGGLNLDVNPLTVPNNVLSDCLNGTFVTFNGQDMTLQNDMGNTTISDKNNFVSLKEGYIPIGSASLGGILYIASYNPLTNKSQLGTFPSPDYNSKEQTYKGESKYETEFIQELIKGDKNFPIYDENGEAVVVFKGDYISDVNIIENETITKLIKYGYITPHFYAGNVELVEENSRYILKENTCGELNVILHWTPMFTHEYHYDTANNTVYIRLIKKENSEFNKTKGEGTSMTIFPVEDKSFILDGDYRIISYKGEDIKIKENILIQFPDNESGVNYYSFTEEHIIEIDEKEIELTKNNKYITECYCYKYLTKFYDVDWELRKIDIDTKKTTTQTYIVLFDSQEQPKDGFYIFNITENSVVQTYIRPACASKIYNDYYEEYHDNKRDFLNINLNYNLSIQDYTSFNTTRFNNLYSYDKKEESVLVEENEYLYKNQTIDITKSYSSVYNISSDNVEKENLPYDSEYTLSETLNFTSYPCEKNVLKNQSYLEYFLKPLSEIQYNSNAIGYHVSRNKRDGHSDEIDYVQIYFEDDFPHARSWRKLPFYSTIEEGAKLGDYPFAVPFTDVEGNIEYYKIIDYNNGSRETYEIKFTVDFKDKDDTGTDKYLTVDLSGYNPNYKCEFKQGTFDEDGNIQYNYNELDEITDSFVVISDNTKYATDYISGDDSRVNKYYLKCEYNSTTKESKLIAYHNYTLPEYLNNYNTNCQEIKKSSKMTGDNNIIKYNARSPIWLWSNVIDQVKGNTARIQNYSEVFSEDDSYSNFITEPNLFKNNQFIKVDARRDENRLMCDHKDSYDQIICATDGDHDGDAVSPVTKEYLSYKKEYGFWTRLESSLQSLCTFNGVMQLLISTAIVVGGIALLPIGLSAALTIGALATLGVIADVTAKLLTGNKIDIMNACIMGAITATVPIVKFGASTIIFYEAIGDTGWQAITRTILQQLSEKLISYTITAATVHPFVNALSKAVYNIIEKQYDKADDGRETDSGALIWKKNDEEFYICVFQNEINSPLLPLFDKDGKQVFNKHYSVINDLLNRIYVPVKNSKFNKLTEFVNKITIDPENIKYDKNYSFELTGIGKIDSNYISYDRFKKFELLNFKNIKFENGKCIVSIERSSEFDNLFNVFKNNLQSEITNKINSIVNLLITESAILFLNNDNNFIFEDASNNLFNYGTVYVDNGCFDYSRGLYLSHEFHFTNKFTYTTFNGIPTCIPNEDSLLGSQYKYCAGGYNGQIFFDKIAGIVIPTTYWIDLNQDLIADGKELKDLDKITIDQENPEKDINLRSILNVTSLYYE